MYDELVPVLERGLTALSGILDKAEAHCAAKKIAPDALIDFRLYPDMWPFARQVSAATDHARRSMARLAGEEPVNVPDSPPTFEVLRARIASTLETLRAADRKVIDDSEGRTIRFPVGPREMAMSGADYVRNFILPNFYFHCTAAYVGLRHNGVELSKMDFLGKV